MDKDKIKYYKYLDNVLVQSKFTFPLFNKGATLLKKNFTQLDHTAASKILINWIVDTDPFNRLKEDQLKLFN